MSVHEIEQAITRLSPAEISRLRAWIASFPTDSEDEGIAHGGIPTRPATLADAMGDLLGAVGNHSGGSQTSSRDGGKALTDHLLRKKRERRL